MNPLQFDGFPDNSNGDDSGDNEDLSTGFLKNVDEADRAIVEKYIKDWDGNVTKHIQSIHDQYTPYKQIGMDPDTLRNAAWLYSQLDTDPVTIYKNIHRALKESGMWEDPEDQQFEGGRQDPLPEFDGIPKEFLDRFSRQEQELASLREMTNGFVQSQQEASEMAMLDDVLGQMHNHYGDFDEEWVLTRLARGKTPQEAMTEYQGFVEGIANSRSARKPAPNVFGGSGSIPAGQVDSSKRGTPQDRRALIAAALEASQQ